MGGGKGGGGSKSTQTVTPYLKSEVKNASRQAYNLYRQGQPAYYPDQTYVDYSPETQQALNMITNRATDGSPLTQAAQDTTLATVNGDYLQNNPYIDQVINTSLNDVNKKYAEQILPGLASNFAGSGRYGSGIQQQLTTDAVGQLGREAMGVASGIRYDNYNNERQRQLQAAALAPTLAQSDYIDAQQLLGVGTAREALDQAKLQDAMDRYWYNANGKNNALDQYISRLGALNGSSSITSASGPQASRAGSAIGGALGGLGMMGSMQGAYPAMFQGAVGALGPQVPGALSGLGGPWGLAAGAGLGLLGGLFS